MSRPSSSRPAFVMFVFDPSAQTVTRVPLAPKRYAVETRFWPDNWEN